MSSELDAEDVELFVGAFLPWYRYVEVHETDAGFTASVLDELAGIELGEHPLPNLGSESVRALITEIEEGGYGDPITIGAECESVVGGVIDLYTPDPWSVNFAYHDAADRHFADLRHETRGPVDRLSFSSDWTVRQVVNKILVTIETWEAL